MARGREENRQRVTTVHARGRWNQFWVQNTQLKIKLTLGLIKNKFDETIGLKFHHRINFKINEKLVFRRKFMG